MDNKLFAKAAKYLREKKNQKRWKQILTVMACIVVFGTTYSLILPAITMTDQTYCGYEAHVHQDSCYEEGVLVCGIEEHVHTEECCEEEVALLEEDAFCPEEDSVDAAYEEFTNDLIDLEEGDLLEDEPAYDADESSLIDLQEADEWDLIDPEDNIELTAEEIPDGFSDEVLESVFAEDELELFAETEEGILSIDCEEEEKEADEREEDNVNNIIEDAEEIIEPEMIEAMIEPENEDELVEQNIFEDGIEQNNEEEFVASEILEEIIELEDEDGGDAVIETEAAAEAIIETEAEEAVESVIETEAEEAVESVIETEAEEAVESVIETEAEESAESVIETEAEEAEESIIETEAEESAESVIETEASEIAETESEIDTNEIVDETSVTINEIETEEAIEAVEETEEALECIEETEIEEAIEAVTETEAPEETEEYLEETEEAIELLEETEEAETEAIEETETETETEAENQYIFEDETITVTAVLEEGYSLPQEARLEVTRILPEDKAYRDYYQQAEDLMKETACNSSAQEESEQLSETSQEELISEETAELDPDENAQLETEQSSVLSELVLYDIRFIVDGEEIEPDGKVDVRIWLKTGELADTSEITVIHYGEEKTELLENNVENSKENGTVSIDFTTDSFSIYGLAGEVEVMALSADTDKVVIWRQTYDSFYNNLNACVIYAKVNNKYYALLGDGTSAEITPSNASGTKFLIPNDQNYFWQVEWDNNGSRSIRNLGTNRYINMSNGSILGYSKSSIWVDNDSQYGNSPETGYLIKDSGNGYLQLQIQQNGTVDYGWSGTHFFFANATEAQDGNWRHPQGAITGSVDTSGLTFFNIDTAGVSSSSGTQSYSNGLAGVEYKIYNANGQLVRTITTTDNLIQHIDTLADGTYTIQQTNVPEGYVVHPQTKTITISNGVGYIGMFYDYKQEPGSYVADKTAEVVNYANRTYKVNLAASSGALDFTSKKTKYELIVDQSNSMLFPAQLTKVQSGGQDVKVTLYQISNSRNGCNLDQLVSEGKIDLNQVYYVIADEQNTSTVYAIWNDGTGWCYQDAAYYCKAQMYWDYGVTHNTSEINSSGAAYYPEYAVPTKGYSDGNKTGGGGLDYVNGSNGVGGTLGKELGSGTAMQLYTGSTYNRLHDLQQAVVILGTQLSAIDPNASIDLITFDKEVESCVTINRLDSGGLNQLLTAVDGITTSGGTRQDKAMNHVMGTHNGNNTANHYKDHLASDSDNVVILVTDGAPVRSGNDTAVTVESCINVGNTLKGRVTRLVTVGLSTQNVTGGTKLLSTIATSGYFYQPVTAAELADRLLSSVLQQGTYTRQQSEADVKDVISDSFYPIDPATNQPLTSGTRIDLEGYVNRNGPGTILYDETRHEWYVTWNGQTLPVTGSGQWQGHVYLKAKEDFIGGNAIDTNKEATVTLIDSQNNKSQTPFVLSVPNVNVRLLPVAGYESEETIFLGDTVSGLEDKLKKLLEKTAVQKIVSGTGDVLNKYGSSEEAGCYAQYFTLPYAIGDLTSAQWSSLKAGNEVTIPYTYDDNSSHGAVGYFSFRLVKTGDTAKQDLQNHAINAFDTSVPVGKNVETYTLQVTYTTYTLGERNRTNVANAYPAGPGTEVGGTGAGNALEEGLGNEQVQDTHRVHVVDGKITIQKQVNNLMAAENQDRTFTFELYKKETNEWQTTTAAADQCIGTYEVNVPAGQTTGSLIEIPHLPRGTYYVKEVVDTSRYYLDTVTVGDASTVTDPADCAANGVTNCKSTKTGEDNDQVVFFHIGYTEDTNTDVIESTVDAQTSEPAEYSPGHLRYSQATQNGAAIASDNSSDYHNISRGHVIFVNAVNKLPVVKRWDDSKVTGTPQDHTKETVYLALYKGNDPVKSGDAVSVLKLTSTYENTDPEGYFLIPSRSTEGYAVREITGLSVSQTADSKIEALVTDSDRNKTTLYYQQAIEANGLITIKGNDGKDTQYNVTYSTDDTGEVQKLVVTNTPREIQILLQKVNADNTPLSGAKFKLYRDVPENTAGSKEFMISNKTVYGVLVQNDEYSSETKTIQIGTQEITINGLITCRNLTGGIYYLEETQAPSGYNLLTEPVKIIISGERADYYYKGNPLTNGIYLQSTEDDGVYTVSVIANSTSIPNTAGHVLPETGGTGTKRYTIAGWLLIMAALLYGYRIYRKRERGLNTS